MPHAQALALVEYLKTNPDAAKQVGFDIKNVL
jgi:hypothetical protein